MMGRRWIRALALAALAFGLASCGGGGGGIGGTGIAMSTMRVSMTDAPACGFDHVWVTVKSVRVHRSDAADPADPSGWFEIPVDAPGGRRIDLLDLRNGVQTELGLIALPAGRYQQMRLVLADNTGVSFAPFPNGVVPSGETQERALDTPSGQQTGLKLNLDVTVPEGKEANVLLDFDACNSVKGAGPKYNLTPVIGVTTEIRDAGLRIVGYVAESLIGSAQVSVVQPDGILSAPSVAPDPFTGRFTIQPLPEGNDYSVVVTAPNHATGVVTGVPVRSGAPTDISGANAIRLALAAASSGVRGVTGVVSPSTATVRALQVLSSGSTIDVQHAPVAPSTGSFAFSLPIDPPRTVGYAVDPPSITFAPDLAASGLYTVQATWLGVNQSRQVDVKNTVQPLTFAF